MAEPSPRDRPLRAIGVTLCVAFVCALMVSYASITLRPYYLANLEAERAAQLGSILETLTGTVGAIVPADIETRVIDLGSGRYTQAVDPMTYDARKAATDPGSSVAIPPHMDLARIKRRADYAVVFIVRGTQQEIRALILPVYGSGYQSTLYGFLALSEDANTVLALRFYEQNDTPGIGARIQEQEWEALWPGKRLLDETGALRIGVARGKVARSSVDADYKVDGISGATRTSLGVNDLVRFWLGQFGFGAYLERVRRGEG